MINYTTLRTLLFLTGFCLPLITSAQKFEMPSAELLQKNKIRSLDLFRAGDTTTRGPFASYRFDDKGRVIYTKSPAGYGEKPYYTLTKYNKKGEKSEDVLRYDDGTFKERILFTWVNDSVRIEKHYSNKDDTTKLCMEYTLMGPTNIVRWMVGHNAKGERTFVSGGIFDKSGKTIGCYDSTAQTRTATESIYYKWKQVRKYDSLGRLINVIKMEFDSAGLIKSLTDSVPGVKKSLRYTISRKNGFQVYKDNVELKDLDLYNFSDRYKWIHMHEPVTPPMFLPAPARNCYTHHPQYDADGLITQDTIDYDCYVDERYYQETVLYRYGH